MSESSQSVVRVIRCIVCPTGCEIQVKKNESGETSFEGYACKRGLEYAQQEFYEPKRILTTTMRVQNGFLPLIPVRTDVAILKDKLGDALKEIAVKQITAPIKAGDILIENILDSGANIIASRDLSEIQ